MKALRVVVVVLAAAACLAQAMTVNPRKAQQAREGTDKAEKIVEEEQQPIQEQLGKEAQQTQQTVERKEQQRGEQIAGKREQENTEERIPQSREEKKQTMEERQQTQQKAEEETRQTAKEREPEQKTITPQQKVQQKTEEKKQPTQQSQQVTEQKEQQKTPQKQPAEEKKQEATEQKRQQTTDQKQTTKKEPQQTKEQKEPQTTEKKPQTQQPQQTTEIKQQTQETKAAEKKDLQTTEEKQQQKAQLRVLFLSPFAPRSHLSFFGGIVNALADAGHHVTVVLPHKSIEARDEVRTVLVEEGDATGLVKDPFKDNRLTAPITAAVAGVERCSTLLAKPQVQELLKEKFDVVIISLVFSDCFLSLVYQLKVPFIWVSPLGMFVMTSAYIGSPQLPSFVGTKLTHLSHPLTFPQRVFATLLDTSLTTLHTHLFLPSADAECRRRGLCPPDMPSLQDMVRNGSMVMLNSVRSLEMPARPMVPAELYLGGIHCRPAKPLTPELEAWVEGAGDAGFIFFSLGSVIKPSTMPEESRVALLEAFATLKQRVLWKWDEDTMEGLSPNVRLAKWLPQQDILGHPRLRLFITHGGLMSTIEASCHGVPVLGLPAFADQHTNMQQTQEAGWGRYLTWEELTAQAVREAILETMTDNELRARARHRSVMMRDQPMTPAETAVFWVEYVVRHRGASHLRCPAVDLPWYKLYNVDVWVTVAAVVLVVTYVTFRLTLALCSCLCCSRAGKTKKD